MADPFHCMLHHPGLVKHFLTGMVFSLCSSPLFINAQIDPPAGIGDGSNLILWLSPDTAVYNNTGDPAAVGEEVYEWHDISGNGFTFTNTRNNNRPVFDTLNGESYLDFTPGDLLENTAIRDSINGLNAFSIFVVVKSNVTNTDNGIFYWKYPPDGQDDGICMRYDANGWHTTHNNMIKAGLQGDQGVNQVETTSNTQTTQKQTITITWKSGGKLYSYLDGEANDSSDATVAGPLNGIEEILIGKGAKDGGTNSGWNGRIGTVIFYNSQFSKDTIEDIAQQLRSCKTIASGNWSDPSIWSCDQAPADTQEVSISAADTVTLDGTVKAHDLSIIAEGQLNAGNDHTLELTGNWSNNGSFLSKAGKVIFTGTDTQTIKGNTVFFDLQAENPTNIEITSGQQKVRGTFALKAGTFLTNDALTFTSDSNGTGRIAMTEGDTVIGKVFFQRFIPKGNSGWIDLGPPVSGETLAGWDDDIYLSGKQSGGFQDACATAVGGDCFWSVKQDDDSGSGDLKDMTSTGTQLVRGTGYEFFIGDEGGVGSMKNDTTLTMEGTISKGSVSIPVTSANGQWNLIANPFGSPVSFDSLYQNNNIGSTYYVAAATGNYEFYDASSGTSSGPVPSNGKIASSQGFWITSTDGSDVVLEQSYKVDASPGMVKTGQQEEHPPFKFLLKNTSNGLSCQSFLQFSEKKAIPHFQSPIRHAPGLFWSDTTQHFQRSQEGPKHGPDTLPFMLHTPVPGHYKLSWKLPPWLDTPVRIEQSPEQKVTDLRSSSSLSFYHGDPSKETHSWKLIFGKSSNTSPTPSRKDLQIIRGEKGKAFLSTSWSRERELTLRLFDVSGQRYWGPRKVVAGTSLLPIPLPSTKGLYLLQVEGENVRKTLKVGAY